MATAKKLPSGQWRVLAYIGTGPDGKRQYKSFTAGTKKEAEYMAAEYKLTEQRPSSPSKMTVGQLIDQNISPQPGQIFYNDTVDKTRFNIGEHLPCLSRAWDLSPTRGISHSSFEHSDLGNPQLA